MILVTGGTGFIGGHLLEKLSASGQAAKCLVRRKTALPPGMEPVFGDLVTGEGLERALDGVDTVMHLAGVTKALTPEGYYAGNARATEKLARACPGRGIRLIHVSSLAAAGPSADKPLDEDAEPHPITNYGKSKLEAEQVVRALMPDAVIVRPPVVYGPRDTGVLHILKSVARGVVLEIAGGERCLSMIYVRDLVDGILAAARSPVAAGRTYFMAYPVPVTWTELGATAARIMGKKPVIVRIPLPMARAVGYCAEIWSMVTRTAGIISREKIAEARCMRWTCDTRRAASELGFTAPTSLAGGLSETLAWYKEAGWIKY